MTVLLTNDDGFQAPGIHSVRAAFIEAGIRVITVAPDGPRSGVARGRWRCGPVRVELAHDDRTNPVWACDGTPVDCVRVALLTTLAKPVQLVISGANQGANLGDDATYSSTVGAAIEGALLGLPAMAISQQSADGRFLLVDRAGHEFSGSAALALALAQTMLAHPPPQRSVLNVNVPGRALTGPIEIATLGRRVWRRGGLVEEHTEEYGHGYYSFGVTSDSDPGYDAGPETDFAAIAAGHACITPLSLDWGNQEAPAQLRDWLNHALPGVADATGLLAGR